MTPKQIDTYLKKRLGKSWSAPFCGSTWATFEAWVALCHAWYLADSRERPFMERALRDLLPIFQQSELPAVRAAIGACGYEQAEDRLWPTLQPLDQRR